MTVLQTDPLPLGYHTKKNVCLIYRKEEALSIEAAQKSALKQQRNSRTFLHGFLQQGKNLSKLVGIVEG